MRLLSSCVALCVLMSASADAQTRIGVSFGRSFAGASGSRVPLVSGDGSVFTGAGRGGWFGSAQVEAPIGSSPFSFRSEFSISRLGQRENAVAAVPGGGLIPTASFDRSIGLSTSLVAATSRTATVAPYAVMGLGWYLANVRREPTELVGPPTRLSASGNGIGVQLGAGLRWRTAGVQLLLETRLVQPMSNVRGTSYQPLTLGVQF